MSVQPSNIEFSDAGAPVDEPVGFMSVGAGGLRPLDASAVHRPQEDRDGDPTVPIQPPGATAGSGQPGGYEEPGRDKTGVLSLAGIQAAGRAEPGADQGKR